MPLERPIPSFYCCYLLRSTVRHSSLYVGSTPNPVRRLRQHNGEAKGGAARTSRDSMRPWEMTAIVTGFPSHVAALQFEWAWQNPHVTLHIPPSNRITHTTAKRKSGRPKRPHHSIPSLLSNLHLLLRVPSFSRWPLQLHFFAPDVYKAWLKTASNAIEDVRESLCVITDFPPIESRSRDEDALNVNFNDATDVPSHGIAALDISYAAHKPYIAKARNIFDFEREGACKLCKESLCHDKGIYAVCTHSNCESVTHLKCLSMHFIELDPARCSLGDGDGEALVPIEGNCPTCGGRMRWLDVVTEATLRMRGPKVVERLLKEKRKRPTNASPQRAKANGKRIAVADEILDSDLEETDPEDEETDEFDDEDMDVMEDDAKIAAMAERDEWFVFDGSDDNNGNDDEIKSMASKLTRSPAKEAVGKVKVAIVIEDSDWDEADVLD